MTKAGIVGIGAVGVATAMAIVLRGQVRELVLVNRNRERAQGVAADMRYGATLSPPVKVTDGDYGDLAGAGVVVITAGVNERREGRQTATTRPGACAWSNLTRGCMRRSCRASRRRLPEAVILVVTDPPEPLVDVARALAGHQHVIAPAPTLTRYAFARTWPSGFRSIRGASMPTSSASTGPQACFCGPRPVSGARI